MGRYERDSLPLTNPHFKSPARQTKGFPECGGPLVPEGAHDPGVTCEVCGDCGPGESSAGFQTVPSACEPAAPEWWGRPRLTLVEGGGRGAEGRAPARAGLRLVWGTLPDYKTRARLWYKEALAEERERYERATPEQRAEYDRNRAYWEARLALREMGLDEPEL